MQKYFGVVQTASGAAVANAAVAVQLYPAGTAAAVYSDNGVTSAANPLTTDTQGNYAFYAADGRYQLVITRTGITTSTVLDILLDDPTNASPVVATTLTVTGAATVGAGLAVTGTLSATGTIQSTSASQAFAGSALIRTDTGTGTGQSFTGTGGLSNFQVTHTNASTQVQITNTGGGGIRLNTSVGGSGVDVTTTGLAVTGTLSATGTVNFGSGAVQTDANGNLGLGVTPSAWTGGFKSIDFNGASFSATSNGAYTTTNASFLAGGWTYKTTAGAVQYQQTANNHIWFTAPSGTAGNPITFTQSLQIGKATALTLEGGTSTTGTGIAFPATQLPSANPNTLDDYAEGNWTPNQGAGLTVVGTFSSSGAYTKVGRLVTVQGQLNATTSVAVGSGGQVCTNLPFTSNGIHIGSFVNGGGSSGGQNFTSSSLILVSATAMSAAPNYIFSITYFV